MVILGLILVLLALILGAALIRGTSAPDVMGQKVDIQLFESVTINLNPMTLVIAGMASMFVLWFGLVLIRSALVHKKKQRRLRKEHEIAARERQEREHQKEVRAREEEELRRRDAGSPVPPGAEADATRPTAHGDDAGATRPIGTRGVEDPGATRPLSRGDGV